MREKTRILTIILAAVLVLAAIALITIPAALGPEHGPELPIVHQSDLFIDVDDDGDLDYVLSIDYVANDDPLPGAPIPAPTVAPELSDPTPSPRS